MGRAWPRIRTRTGPRGTSRGRAVAVLAAVVAVAGAVGIAPASASPEPDELRVTVRWAPGQTDSWTLTCDPTGGNHPNARRACAQLSRIPVPFAAPPSDLMCAQVWSGPETARVTGTWDGLRVDRRFSRTDGCQTARWNQYRALFTDPNAVTVHGRVDLGPTCPVQQEGQDCTTEGATAMVIATSRSGSRRAASDAVGFSLHLRRAAWTFTADAGMSCTPVRLDLRETRRPPDIVIDCDTGIR